MLKPYYYLAIIAVVVAAWFGHVVDKKHAVTKAVDTTKLEMNIEYTHKLYIARDKAIKIQNTMQEAANKDRKTKDEKINDLSAKLDVALVSLRNRPQRPAPTANTPNPTSVQPCTARGLYREDAEFLTREASRAQSILVERDYYFNEYEKVRNSINGIAK